MTVQIEPSWKKVLHEEFTKSYFLTLTETVQQEYLESIVYPPPSLIFNAFTQTSFTQVKVVILGQDPYHGASQAMGLSFSVPVGVTIPPSLRNIYKELRADLGVQPPSSGNLEHWTRQGVLLLNTVLTVRAGEAGSHRGLGWEEFTDSVIKTISDKKDRVVFLLWGGYAAKKASLINNSKHLILTAPHPSPLSAHRGFFGCRHFSKTNDFLQKHNYQKIIW